MVDNRKIRFEQPDCFDALVGAGNGQVQITRPGSGQRLHKVQNEEIDSHVMSQGHVCSHRAGRRQEIVKRRSMTLLLQLG